ncbi:MAG: MgtC/SapB family protein [Nitrospinota bacterium]
MELNAGVIFLRLLLSTILGGFVGVEREWRNQPAGLRTHLILSLGAALVTVVSIKLGNQTGSDPTRIAANIVTGVGFLGAGAILRLGISIRGLTTAASIWTTAGIGMAVGAGVYAGAFMATGFVLLGLVILRGLESHIFLAKGTRSIFLKAQYTPDVLKRMEGVLQGFGASIVNMEFRRDRDLERLEIRAVLETGPDLRPADLTNALKDLDEIVEVEIR